MLQIKEPIYATKCGDNCIKHIVEIAKKKDLHITLHHCMEFPLDLDAIMEDTGERVDGRSFVSAYYRIRHNRPFN